MAMKAMASKATRPSTTIQIHILFELVLSLVWVVVCVGRVVCVVVVVVVVFEVFPVVCVAGPELALFWASAGTAKPTLIRLSTSRHALKLLHN